jgi:hypothetical protein
MAENDDSDTFMSLHELEDAVPLHHPANLEGEPHLRHGAHRTVGFTDGGQITSSFTDERTPAQKVLDIPELLEPILLDLGSLDLLSVSKTCRAAAAMVSSSLPLRRTLFLTPRDSDQSELPLEILNSKRYAKGFDINFSCRPKRWGFGYGPVNLAITVGSGR